MSDGRPAESNETERMENSGAHELYLETYRCVQGLLSRDIDAQRINAVTEKIINAFSDDLYNDLLLIFFTQSKDNYLITHITNNVILALGFGVSLSLKKETLLDVGQCAFGHDVAMAEYLPLFQKRGELSESESAQIKNHTRKSADLFRPAYSPQVIQGILDVHEQADGQGYPEGKTAVEISPIAKIVSICDVYESLTHVRNFRQELNPYEAIKLIIQKKDMIFDGSVVNRFVDFLSIYPVGTFVRLNTGETGMVVAACHGYPTRGKVRVLMSAQNEPVPEIKEYDLLENTMIYVIEPVDRAREQEMLARLNPRGTLEL